jgi:hypothetical protein
LRWVFVDKLCAFERENSVSYRISSDGYQLQIGAILNDTSRNSLMHLLVKKGLSMKESKGWLIVYKPS